MRRSGSLCAFAVIFVLAAATTAQAADPAPDFGRDIRPIFAQHCEKCHGEQKQLSGYRLDVRAKAVAGGESGEPAIASGKPDDSPLVAHITSDDKDVRMPPEGRTAQHPEVELVRAWIVAGVSPDELAGENKAKPMHWSFTAPVRPELPTVTDAATIKNPIDQFIVAHLDTEKLVLSPRPTAPRSCAFLSLDLTGLPPTIAEVDAFLADNGPKPTTRRSSACWPRPTTANAGAGMWLDAARYADSDGYEKDKPRFVWAYRDWVVEALNRDLPYDQFIIEQIAGDLLPDATQDQIVATGFLRNSMLNEEGGIDPEQFRMEAMFDRMDAIGKNMLGVTIQCCQCHNHKYDPITQEEYYRMFAFLNDTDEANRRGLYA